MDTPQASQPAEHSVLEQWLVEYVQHGGCCDSPATDLAALADQQAWQALQVIPVPGGATLLVEFAAAVADRAATGIDVDPAAEAPADPKTHDETSPDPKTHDETSVDPDAETPADPDVEAGSETVAGAAVPVPHVSVRAVDGAARARCALEADLVEAAAEVVGECRARILELRKLTGVSLAPAARRSVDAAVRQAAVMELEQATGTCAAEAQTLLAVATCDAELRVMILTCLRRGQTRWSQVKTYWERTTRAHLTRDQRLIVAYALFGTDPALACEERLDPDGTLDLNSPWMHHPYQAALAREITACVGQDPETDANRRRMAYENRRVQIQLHDDGTGILKLIGPAITIAAIRHRLDVAARTLRAAGDERTLSQLRFDIAAALHLHGILDLPQADLDSLDEVLSPERLAELIAVIHAQPKIHAQIIVPVDALKTGLPLCLACADKIHPTTSDADLPEDLDLGLDDDDDDDDDNDNPATPWGHARRGNSPPPWATPPNEEPPDREPPDQDPAGEAPPDRGPAKSCFLDREPPGRGLVGELISPHPAFLTPGHARELVLLPGTTLHRLLTDPADGRLIERTITTYRPDTDMRRQVLAADLYSRSPGSRLTGRALELDHVIPYGTPGGTTSEIQLVALHKRAHHEKTIGHWRLELGTRRDLSITTLLDQHRKTRVHDYNQYLRTAHPHDLAARRDLASQAIYAHEIEHQRTIYLSGDRAALRDEAWVSITHTNPHTGRTHPGPHPDTPTLEHLLNIPDDDATADGSDTGQTES